MTGADADRLGLDDLLLGANIALRSYFVAVKYATAFVPMGSTRSAWIASRAILFMWN
jgi:hypothetical protein